MSRLWRVRRRHDHIDAMLTMVGARWQLEFARNDRPFLAWRYDGRAEAVAEADARLQELLRAGWNTHW